MCRLLKVSRSGFYGWQRGGPSARAVAAEKLDAAIQRLFTAHRRRPGSPKITELLRAEGWQVSPNRVARRMRQLGLHSICRRVRRVTTDSSHGLTVAPNLLARQFSPSGPDQSWVSDITYLRTRDGWLYLVVVIDLYSRLVVGWALGDSLSHHGVLRALRRGVGSRHPARGLLFHSDRGVQYACHAFTKALASHGFLQSMSRKADVWDNAVAESFSRLLKSELADHVVRKGYTDTRRALFEYIKRAIGRDWRRCGARDRFPGKAS